MSGAPVLAMDEGCASIMASTYSVTWTRGTRGMTRSPYLEIYDSQGVLWMHLCVLSSLHTVQGRDEAMSIAEPDVVESEGAVTVSVATRSSRWQQRILEICCTGETIELTLAAEGTGSITDLTILGGDGVLPTGAAGTFRSQIEARAVFVPTPTEPVAFVRPLSAGATLSIVGDADPGRLNGIFSPPPLALAFGRSSAEGPLDQPDGDWLGMSVRSAVTDLTFNQINYEPIDGGALLRFTYEGHTEVNGAWRSPTLVLRPVAAALDAVEAHRTDLIAHGFAPGEPPPLESSWNEPLFCGWGAQVARGGTAAPELCTQRNYDEFLAVLAAADLDPGTIVIDDRWQAEYGTAQPDTAAWPDLRGWIRQQHGQGRRVLLWFKAWDTAGLPAEMCVSDAAGKPVSVDPGSPGYRAYLRESVTRLLSPAGLDADGFKVDFTQRAPSGQSLRSAPDSDGTWGIAALHRLVSEIYAAAKAAKPDSLVITHTVHPSFGDVTDMVRTNDVLERDPHGAAVSVSAQLRMRRDIIAKALPHHLVDTDQWPMPNRAEWLDYARVQAEIGVPALYYLERIDENEPITAQDLAEIRRTWSVYRGSPS